MTRELKKKPSLEKLLEAAPTLTRASFDVSELVLRAGGQALTSSVRDELLAKCAAGEYVELEIELTAYEQKIGEHNRNFVRFRDGEMVGLGRTGKGKPYLRDHAQRDSLARGGTIVDSKTEKLDEGHYVIRQTVRLTAPWAVELALRGLMSTVSIGWNPTGPVLCSVCNTHVFDKCWHYPGERLSEVTDEDGTKRKVRKRTGDIVVQWIFTSAELVETSCVPVPGVPSAGVDEIRAALSAQSPAFCAALAPDGDGLPDHDEEDHMKLLTALAGILGLAATASEDDVTKAVESLKRDRDTVQAKLEIAEGERTRLAAVVEEHKKTERKASEDKFVHDALASGRITKADEAVWRKLFALDAQDAQAEMAKRNEGSATPVGQPRQSANEPAPPAPAVATAVRGELAKAGVNADAALGYARLFGAKNAEKTIAGALGVNQEG